jgi:hypothetical protein
MIPPDTIIGGGKVGGGEVGGAEAGGDRNGDRRGDRLGDHGYQALADPVDDRLFSLFNALTAEVWSLRERVRLAERALGDLGVDLDAEWEARRLLPDEIEAMRVGRDAFVERVYGALEPRPHR